MRNVVILTDFGANDSYNGIMEGVIKTLCPTARITYIAPDVRSWSVYSGAYLLYSAYRHFPKKTVFLVVVDPGVGTERKPLVIKTRNYYFVGPDNGILYPSASEDGIEEVYEINNPKVYATRPPSYTFHGRDIFSPAAALLACRVDPKVFGESLKEIKRLDLEEYSKKGNTVCLRVIHVDKFGNVALSMRPKAPLPIGATIKVTIGSQKVDVKVARTFGDVEKGEKLIYINSFGFIELAVNQGNFSTAMNVEVGDEVCLEGLSFPEDSSRST